MPLVTSVTKNNFSFLFPALFRVFVSKKYLLLFQYLVLILQQFFRPNPNSVFQIVMGILGILLPWCTKVQFGFLICWSINWTFSSINYHVNVLEQFVVPCKWPLKPFFRSNLAISVRYAIFRISNRTYLIHHFIQMEQGPPKIFSISWTWNSKVCRSVILGRHTFQKIKNY